jgi:hypothetical protein
MRIACFVTPHGFGHAARAAAVIEAVGERRSDASFEIITTVPEWFFEQSLTVPFTLRRLACDVGLVQIDPLHEDPLRTVAELDRFWTELRDVAEELVESWADDLPCLVLSDISPLGLEAARQSGVPSILVENFTWDWIYAAYVDEAPALGLFAERYARLAETADLHLQCEPWCRPVAGAATVAPVSRESSLSRLETRRMLGLGSDERPLVLLTMGGMGWGRKTSLPDVGCVFVTLGGVQEYSRRSDLVRLPDRSPVYPPDLVRAADAVVGKLGYSTVAECFRAGTPMGYVRRPRFPESPVLESFLLRRVPAVLIRDGELSGTSLNRLLGRARREPVAANGANEIAGYLCGMLDGERH